VSDLIRRSPQGHGTLKTSLGPLGRTLESRHFSSLRHDTWLKFFDENVPVVAVYTIANPLVAQTIMKHDLRASYNIPPRLLVLEKEDRSGTLLVYHLPSSVTALDANNQELQDAAHVLDKMYEKLIIDVTS